MHNKLPTHKETQIKTERLKEQDQEKEPLHTCNNKTNNEGDG